MALEKLFPNLREECQKVDIHVGPADFKLGHSLSLGDENDHGALPQTLFATRHGLEALIRRLVIGKKRYPNIEQIVGTVTGVVPSASEPSKLQGVTIHTSDGVKVLPATLVVDCTGAAGAGMQWLRRARFGRWNRKGDISLHQLKVIYDPQVRYSTFQFNIPPALAKRLSMPGGYHGDRTILHCVLDGRVDQRGIVAMRCEGQDILQVCCSTRGVTECPNSVAEILAFVKGMILERPVPEWYLQLLDELHEAEESMTISKVNYSLLTYIQYHKARRLPDNFIAIGDSIMRLNPVYGRGCSKALLGAATLNTVLRSSLNSGKTLPSHFSKLFFKAQAAKIDPMWMAEKTLDYEHDCTIPIYGESLSSGRFVRWYSRQLNNIAFRDRQVGLAVYNSIHLLSPAIDLVTPSIVLKVLCEVLMRPFA